MSLTDNGPQPPRYDDMNQQPSPEALSTTESNASAEASQSAAAPAPADQWTPPAQDNNAWRASESQPAPANPSRRSRNRLIALGAAGAAVLIGGGVGAGVALAGHGKSGKSTEIAVGLRDNQSPNAAHPKTPSPTDLPSSSHEAPAPNASTVPTPSRLEQLETMAPLDNPVTANQPYGSAAVVERLYKNLQYADITGRTDMLEAAIGKANMTSDLGTQYEADVVAIQQHFQARPADRLTYQYTAKYVEQDSPDSPTYTLIASEQYAPGQKIESAQKVVLGTEQDPTTGAEHWIIAQVLEAVPVPPTT